jgi:hypothetical protein
LSACLAARRGDKGHASAVSVNGRLAQLVERLLYTQDVGGSSPSPPTSLRAHQRVSRASSTRYGRFGWHANSNGI